MGSTAKSEPLLELPEEYPGAKEKGPGNAEPHAFSGCEP
jgi:hypothetical protein